MERKVPEVAGVLFRSVEINVMEEFKLQNHFKEYASHLPIWTLDDRLSLFIKQQLIRDFELNSGRNNIFKHIHANLENIVNVDVNSDEGFINVINALGIKLLDNDQLYLIWNLDQKVDVVSVNILKTFWSSMWSGESDEALIIYIPSKFLIFISDWGEVGIRPFIQSKI